MEKLEEIRLATGTTLAHAIAAMVTSTSDLCKEKALLEHVDAQARYTLAVATQVKHQLHQTKSNANPKTTP